MTREEAIKILTPFREAMIDQHGCPISDAVYALDVAIKSLEAWDDILHEIGSLGLSWEYGRGVWDCYNIIKKHLKEVE